MTTKVQILDPSKPHTFLTPSKLINDPHDVHHFLASHAYAQIVSFLFQLNAAMFPRLHQADSSSSRPAIIETWRSIPDASKPISDLRALIAKLDAIIDEVPPDPGPRRFGNVSFRTWYARVEERLPELMREHVTLDEVWYSVDSVSGEGDQGAVVGPLDELSAYLLGSFGSAQRLDYGTGHELSFLAFLCGIWKLGGFRTPRQEKHADANDNDEKEQENQGGEDEGLQSRLIVLHLLTPYLHLTRRLIKTYTLEPAGSHGVWGLDDHFFLPYILGSAQLCPPLRSIHDPLPLEGSAPGTPEPADVAKAAVVSRERERNLYFGAIGFIYDVKRGPFWEHSPMLYDISGVKAGWAKINKVR